MLRYLGEDGHVREVNERLEPIFSFAEAIYNLWAQQSWERNIHSMPEECIQLASLINTQALRLFRSVVEQVRRCETYSATILSRTLFETLLAVAFLVKKDIRIIVEPVRPKPGSPPATTAKYVAKIRSKGVKRTRKHLLSYKLRMLLFQAYDYFWLQKAGLNSLAKHPGMFGKVRQFKRTLDPALLQGYEHAIGPEWTYILKNSDNYAGLSVPDRARMAGKSFLRWYEALYPSQSRAVHGIDIHHHLIVLPGDGQVASTLWPAINLMLIHIRQLQDCIDFGPDVDTAFDSLLRKRNWIADNILATLPA
jgi:hypothetical protein